MHDRIKYAWNFNALVSHAFFTHLDEIQNAQSSIAEVDWNVQILIGKKCGSPFTGFLSVVIDNCVFKPVDIICGKRGLKQCAKRGYRYGGDLLFYGLLGLFVELSLMLVIGHVVSFLGIF